MNARGCTVGMSEMAPLEMEYGRGHNRIIMRSLIPSCFKVRAIDAKRGSPWTRPWTSERRTVRETMNEAVLPMMVADATINHLFQSLLT